LLRWNVPQSTGSWNSTAAHPIRGCSEADETHGDDALFQELGGLMACAEND
jgi:hypothetical protein